MKATMNHPNIYKICKCLMLECSVLAPAHRGVGASTASLSLAQTRLTPFWKTAVWRHNLFFPRCVQTVPREREKQIRFESHIL